jgi:gamma-glutamylcyclotransferase
VSLPIAGHFEFVWFIYGSSLDRTAFEAWAREHGYDVPDLSRGFPARLDGWRLAFDVASRYWGGAVGNLVAAPSRSVEGLALPLPGSARALADHKEGANSGLYQAIEVTVVPLAGGTPTPAVAYVALPDRRLPTEAPPSPAWLDAVLRGARAARLSDTWIRELEKHRP